MTMIQQSIGVLVVHSLTHPLNPPDVHTLDIKGNWDLALRKEESRTNMENDTILVHNVVICK